MARKKFPTWATTLIPNLGNGDPSKEDPGSTKQDAGFDIEKPLVQTLNWLLNLIGHFVKSNNQIKATDTLVEVEVGQRVLANNLLAPVTVPLPTEPEDGQWVEIGGMGIYSTHAVFVDGGTRDIMIPTDTVCELDEDNVVYLFWWSLDLSMWRIRKVNISGGVL